MTLRTAYRYAASRLLDTAERGSEAAADALLDMSAEPLAAEIMLGTEKWISGPGWAALRAASTALHYRTERSAMSLLCAQLADEHETL